VLRFMRSFFHPERAPVRGRQPTTLVARGAARTTQDRHLLPVGELVISRYAAVLPRPYRERMATWQRPEPPPRWLRMTQPAYVGRGRQFEALEQAWAGVTAGGRQAVFVGAEAGGGKTRFVVEAALALHAEGAAVLAGACREDMGLALDPFVDPVAAYLAGLDRSNPELRPGTLGHLETVTAGAGWDGRDDLQRSELYAAVVEALRSASELAPVVLVLEDLHWAGQAARDLLKYVVTRTDELPLLVLGTLRSAPPDRSAALSEVVSDLFRLEGVSRLDLAGLDVEEITTYLERNRLRTGGEARRTAAILRDATGGNPFLLRETCRGLVGEAADWAPSAPVSFAGTTAARLTALSEDERLVVVVAAVMGEDVAVAELAGAAGRYAGRPLDRGTVLTALAGAKSAGLLDPGGGDATTARFPHALARDAVVATLTDLERARVHEAIALELDQAHPAAGRRTVRLAAHFAGAAVLGHEAEAVRHLTAAGDQARAASAHVEAADCYERAASYALDPLERDRLLLVAARSALQGWQNDRSRRLDELVMQGVDPELRLRAAIGHAATAWRDGRDARHSRGLLQAMLAGYPDAPADLAVHATASLARLEAWTGHPDAGRRLGAAAREDARALGDAELLAKVLSITMNDGTGFDELDELIARGEELARTPLSGSMLSGLGPGAFHRAASHYVRGDPEPLAAAARELEDIADATLQPFWVWVSRVMAFATALCRAELERAADLLAAARTRVTEGSQGGAGPDGIMSFALRRETGLPPSARAFLARPSASRTWPPASLALATELREPDLAAEWLHHILRGDLTPLRTSATWPAALSFLVDAAVLLDDADAAERLLPMVGRYAGHNLLAAEFLHPLGSADLPLARLLSLLGRPGAEAHFEAALAMNERMGATLHVATTLAAQARHLMLRRAPGVDASAAAGRARVLAERYGLARVARDLDELTALERPRWGLTRREQEVLGLLGRGLSNREISAALFISEYTAANHVRSILMKTRSANRTQAAVLAGSAGDADERPVR
jgi:DNA-binding NarL/FixJ family response regulator